MFKMVYLKTEIEKSKLEAHKLEASSTLLATEEEILSLRKQYVPRKNRIFRKKLEFLEKNRFLRKNNQHPFPNGFAILCAYGISLG